MFKLKEGKYELIRKFWALRWKFAMIDLKFNPTNSNSLFGCNQAGVIFELLVESKKDIEFVFQKATKTLSLDVFQGELLSSHDKGIIHLWNIGETTPLKAF